MNHITIANLFHDAGEKNDKAGYVPIGPLYVTSSLEAAGYGVDFRDYLTGSKNYKDPLDPASVISFLEQSAEVIGIGCASELLPLAILALQEIKQTYPRKKIMIGGIGAAGIGEEILRQFPFIEIVVNGEGERTAVECMKQIAAGKSLKKVRGITYREGDKISTNPKRERIEDPDELPLPAYGKINIDHYANIGIYSGRGCPYRCTFCDVAPFWERRTHAHGTGRVIEEIEMLAVKYKQRTIDIMDDIFVKDKQRTLHLCDAIRKRNLDINWACCGRIDLMDEELMSAMSGSGCGMVFFGIESGSDNVLKKIQKGFTREYAKEVILKSQKYFHISVSLMWGFPFETMKDFNQTVELYRYLKDNGIDVDIYLLAPLPLSQLYGKHKHDLEFFEEKSSRVFGENKKEMTRFIRRYPGTFQWYYRFRTGEFQKKNEIIGKLIG